MKITLITMAMAVGFIFTSCNSKPVADAHTHDEGMVHPADSVPDSVHVHVHEEGKPHRH